MTPLDEHESAALEHYCATHQLRLAAILIIDTTAPGNLNPRDTQLQAQTRTLIRRCAGFFVGHEVRLHKSEAVFIFRVPSDAVLCGLSILGALRENKEDHPLPRIAAHRGQIISPDAKTGNQGLLAFHLRAAARMLASTKNGHLCCSRAVFDDARSNVHTSALASLGSLLWTNHGVYQYADSQDEYEICEIGIEGSTPELAEQSESIQWPAEATETTGWRPAPGTPVPYSNWIIEERLGRRKPAFEQPDAITEFSGRFSEVWRARSSIDPRQTVALKFAFNKNLLRNLRREERLLTHLARAQHPNLVKIHGVVCGDAPPFYIEMEYVDGVTLDQWLMESPSMAMRLDAIAQIAEALDIVHARGIFHRDIKPSNILIQPQTGGAVLAKLTDFGLGAALDAHILGSLQTTLSGATVGTWDHIAPEVRKGKPASPQSDIYSLGVTLYQTVTGRIDCNLADWRHHVRDAHVRVAIAGCLASTPEERWKQARMMADVLRRKEERRIHHLPFCLKVASILIIACAALAFEVWLNLERIRQDYQMIEIRNKLTASHDELDDLKVEQAARQSLDRLQQHIPELALVAPPPHTVKPLWTIATGPGADINNFITALKSTDSATRAWGAFQLGECENATGDAILSALQELTEDESTEVRTVAAEALKKVRSRSIKPPPVPRGQLSAPSLSDQAAPPYSATILPASYAAPAPTLPSPPTAQY